MLEAGAALCWNGWYLGAICPEKECIKSCETCFAKNALKLIYTKCLGFKQKMNLFPKVLGPFGITLSSRPWLRISPSSSLNFIYQPYLPSLIITAWHWLMNFTCTLCIPMQPEPNKSSRKGVLEALFLWEISQSFLPNRSCLGSLISSMMLGDTVGQGPLH